MANEFAERIKKLQKQLKKDGVKAYIVFVTDPHQTEEAAPRFSEERRRLCAFKGSDGILLVTPEASYLYADGRYWIQAEEELAGSATELVRMGDFNVPSLPQFIAQNKLFPLAFDFSACSVVDFQRFQKVAGAGKIIDRSYRELTMDIAATFSSRIWKVPGKLLSTTYKERLAALLSALKDRGAQATLISALDDIAYLLGWRGCDVEFSPLFLAYLYVRDDGRVTLFVNADKVPEKLPGLTIEHYEAIWPFLDKQKALPTLIDPLRTNQRVWQKIPEPILAVNPTQLQKSIKGPVEIQQTKRIHELDALAVLRLWYFVTEHIVKNDEKYSEHELAQIIDGYRLENKDCYGLSFPSIVGFKGHGAMMHYLPPVEGSAMVTKMGLDAILLVDSGGQYYGGTTDITRTWCLGKASRAYVEDYTREVKAVMALAATIFMQGCAGVALDIKAREVMWRVGLDYKSGTGHGVGYMLNCHEGPNGFRYKIVPERDDSHELFPGQIQSDEPGIYRADKYGIRIENELLTVRQATTPDGVFNAFENITYCPLQKAMIDPQYLSDDELGYLNAYQKLCREKLLPYVAKEAKLKAFLLAETTPIARDKKRRAD